MNAIKFTPKGGLIQLRLQQVDSQVQLMVSDTGNVGIGTTSPTEKLQVEGTIKVNGNITSDGEICIGSGC